MQQRFRISSKTLALTYPQCDLGKEEALGLIQRKLQEHNILDYLVAQENHKDGGKHLHMYIKLDKKLDSRDAACLDLNGNHGHYKGATKVEGWIEYLLKEDKEPVASQDWQKWLMNSKQHKRRNENRMKTDLLLEVGPYKMLMMGEIASSQYKTFKTAYELILRDKQAEEALQKEDLPDELPNNWGIKLPINTDNKKCHYWLYSTSPNMGKTTFMDSILDRYRAIQWNPAETYQNQIPKETELIIMDEFVGGMKVSTLNALCDGQLLIPQKGLAPIKLNQKPLVIILGNQSPEETYDRQYQPFIEARFIIIDLQVSAQPWDPFRVNIIITRNGGRAAAAEDTLGSRNGGIAAEQKNGDELEEEKNGELPPMFLRRTDTWEDIDMDIGRFLADK